MASRFRGPFQRVGGDPLVSIYREMNRMVDDVLSGALGAGGRQPGGLVAAPSLDVHESENELCVSIELPGVKAADVDVRLEADVLTVSGEKKSADEQKQANYHVMERSYGRFSRSLQLPFRPDPDQVRADFEHGVLTIRMQRAQQQGSRRIEVRSGSAATGSDAATGSKPATGSEAAMERAATTSSAANAEASATAKPNAGNSSDSGGDTRPASTAQDAQPAPRNDEAGYGVSAGSATEGNSSAGSGAMGSTGTEAASSRSVGP